MEYVLMPLFWVIGLFDTRSSDPVLHARKKAELSAYLCVAGSFVLSLICYSLDVNSIVERTSLLQTFAAGIKELIGLGLALATLLLWLAGLWNMWIYYRTHSRPELFFE